MHELALKDIELNLPALYTPEQDGIAKTSNRINANNTNTFIKWMNSSKSFWVPAMETAVYISNRTT